MTQKGKKPLYFCRVRSFSHNVANMYRLFFSILFFSGLFNNSSAQVVIDEDSGKQSPAIVDTFAFADIFSLDITNDIQPQLIPLDSIIELAYYTSPTLKFHGAEVDVAEQGVILAKRSWHNVLSGFFTTSVGNQNVLLTSISNNNQSYSTVNGYSTGISVSVPLAVFTNTPVRVKQMRADLAKYEYRMDEARMILRRQIIKEYFELITAQRIMRIVEEEVQSTTMTVTIAEFEFQNGKIGSSEFSRLKNMQTIARTNYELRFKEFATTYFQFEAIVGVDMFKLKKEIK